MHGTLVAFIHPHVILSLVFLKFISKKKNNSCFCYTYPELSAELGQEIINNDNDKDNNNSNKQLSADCTAGTQSTFH